MTTALRPVPPLTEAEQYAAEFTEIAGSLRQTCQGLLAELNRLGHPSAATCVAELADHVTEVLRAAALLAQVYVAR